MKAIKACLASILLSVFMVNAVLAQAPEGTVLASWDSTTYGVGLGFDGQFIYVPDGIDATQLKIYDTAGIFQGNLVLTCNIGNLSYDSTRNVFWAGQVVGASAPIYTIDPATGVCTLQFDAWPAMVANGNCGNGCASPFDGIDYDERDDTVRVSLDGSTIIYNLNLDGTFNSSFGPIDTFDPCGLLGDGSFSSGIATGQSEILYSATNGCTEVFKWDKDTGAKLDHFTLAADRNEAMECDNVTFAGGGNDAIWVKDLNGPIQAFAVPEDTCEIIAEPTIEKFYTYTNNDWADRCVETNADTGECIKYRLPNVNVDSDIFAAELPKDNGTFLLYGQEKRKKTVVTPGQYIAVSVVEVPVERDIRVVEDFSDCTDIGKVKPNKVPGGVQVVLVDANGDVHDIDDDLADGIGGSISLGTGSAIVHVEGVPAGSQLRVLVKFQPSRQAEIGDACINVEQLVDEAGEVMSEATAVLEIVPALGTLCPCFTGIADGTPYFLTAISGTALCPDGSSIVFPVTHFNFLDGIGAVGVGYQEYCDAPTNYFCRGGPAGDLHLSQEQYNVCVLGPTWPSSVPN